MPLPSGQAAPFIQKHDAASLGRQTSTNGFLILRTNLRRAGRCNTFDIRDTWLCVFSLGELRHFQQVAYPAFFENVGGNFLVSDFSINTASYSSYSSYFSTFRRRVCRKSRKSRNPSGSPRLVERGLCIEAKATHDDISRTIRHASRRGLPSTSAPFASISQP